MSEQSSGMAGESRLTSEQKILYVEHQIREAEKGNINMMECPYCGLGLVVGCLSLCCDLMGQAVAAVLGKLETQDQLDQAARICDGIEAQSILQ